MYLALVCHLHYNYSSHTIVDDARHIAGTESNAGEEGLSEYAMDTIPEDLLQQAGSDQGLGSEGFNRAWVSLNNPNPAVVENLQGLAKVVTSRHLPRVQGWLKVLVKVSILYSPSSSGHKMSCASHISLYHLVLSSIVLQVRTTTFCCL